MGYVIVDHTQSLPSVKKQYGGGLIEYDTVQCKHCGGVLKVEHRQHTGLYCMSCAGPIHDRPECAKVICERGSQHWLRQLLIKVSWNNFAAKLRGEL